VIEFVLVHMMDSKDLFITLIAKHFQILLELFFTITWNCPFQC